MGKIILNSRQSLGLPGIFRESTDCLVQPVNPMDCLTGPGNPMDCLILHIAYNIYILCRANNNSGIVN